MLALDHWKVATGGPLNGRETSNIECMRWKDSSGPLVIYRRRIGEDYLFTLALNNDLTVEILPDRRIVSRVCPGLPPHTIDHFLRDQVAPRVLAHEGRFVLHSGGVRVEDCAILLMGATGRGKSTLAASLDRAGYPLLGDDAMIVDRADRPSARAVYPSLRLLPDSIAALYSAPVATSAIAHYSPKQRVALPDVEEARPLPIRAIFVIAEPPGKDQISIARMNPSHACMALVENSFALDPADLEQARGRLNHASRLAARVPIFEIAYPRAFDRLPEVHAALLDRIEGEGCQ